jgi:hypothetical protein
MSDCTRIGWFLPPRSPHTGPGEDRFGFDFRELWERSGDTSIFFGERRSDDRSWQALAHLPYTTLRIIWDFLERTCFHISLSLYPPPLPLHSADYFHHRIIITAIHHRQTDTFTTMSRGSAANQVLSLPLSMITIVKRLT